MASAIAGLHLLTLVLSGALSVAVSARLWPAGPMGQEPESSRRWPPRRRPLRPRPLSPEFHRALFQKDLRDLRRNPAYRQALASVLVLLPLALWGQYRSQPSPTGDSSRLMTMSLPLVYAIPMFFTARAMAQEIPFLDGYRLALSSPASVLAAKLRMLAPVNCLAVLAVGIPFFLLLDPGFDTIETSYYTACAILFAPLLTMLALALGCRYPSLPLEESVLGIRFKGVLLYFALAIPLYSLLLELYQGLARGEVGTSWVPVVAYGLGLSLTILWLYRRTARSLCEGRLAWQVARGEIT